MALGPFGWPADERAPDVSQSSTVHELVKGGDIVLLHLRGPRVWLFEAGWISSRDQLSRLGQRTAASG